MTQEEKAKAYDEIIKKANKMHNENCEACKACLEELIPELIEESEDERIRKALITYFSDEDESYDGIPYPSILAWLEKQSKASKVEQAMREVEEKAEAFTEAHKGETSEEILAQMRGEQKPAWSEEDNIILSRIIADYERSNEEWFNAQKSLPHGRKITWLKSIKDRVQPKQEWGEEDEKLWVHDDDIFLAAAKMIVEDSPRKSYGGVHKKEIVPWFYSLKERLKSLRPPFTAKHFFELGMSVSSKAQKEE